MVTHSIIAIGITEIPEIIAGDDIASKILEAILKVNLKLKDEDIVVVASKIVSKAENRLISAEDIIVSERAKLIAKKSGFDPYQVELALRESREILRDSGVLITETHSGLVCNFAGVDKSNTPEGYYILLPEDADVSAERIRKTLVRETRKQIAVIISDTQGRPWRKGSVNLAIGCAGISPFKYNRGKRDLYGRILERSTVCQIDELASLVEPIMGQAGQSIPVVVIRGYEFIDDKENAKAIIRHKDEDLFR